MHAHWRFGLVAFGNLDLDAQAFIAGEAVKDVDDVEALGTLGPIHGGDIDEVIEIGIEFEELEDGYGQVRLGHDEVLSEIGGSRADSFAKPLLDFTGEVALPWRGGHDRGRLRGGRCWLRRSCFRSFSGWFCRWRRIASPRGRRRLRAPRLLLVSHVCSS